MEPEVQVGQDDAANGDSFMDTEQGTAGTASADAAGEDGVTEEAPVADAQMADTTLNEAPEAEAAVAEAAGNAEQGAEKEKKKRGKPKDDKAPPKPKNGYQRVTGEARGRLRLERPELASDLKAMTEALKAEWEKVPENEKERLQREYEAEMEIWRPKWEAYKQTPEYKEFFEVKQDWIDARQKRKLVKKHAKAAPKRPKSGYMLFADTVRDVVKNEVEEAGGGMGDIGKKISERWNALAESQKAEFGEQAARQKEDFDVKYAEYQKTEDFKSFMEEKAKLEGKQQLKKLVRTALDEAPRKAPSAFALFRSKVFKAIMEENKGADRKEIAAKLKAAWEALAENDRAEYAEEATRRKEEYAQQLKDFKRRRKYTEFLEKRQKVKSKENKALNLREMPKRPKSVFALFAAEHKGEVEKGKGEGKGVSALKKKWAEASPEVRSAYEAKEKELKAQWEKEVNDYKESEKYQGFTKTDKKIKQEFMNEAMKVMTLKFLNKAPAQPVRSAFALFLNEKRRLNASEEAGPAKKARGQEAKDARKEELTRFQADWDKLDKDTKAAYEAQRKEEFQRWEAQVKEYMAQEEWQEYVKEAKRLRLPVKKLLSQKKKQIRKLKSGLRIVPMPSKPSSAPSKPPSAKRLFFEEKKKDVPDLTTIEEMWNQLEDKSAYTQEAQRRLAEYEAAVAQFKASADGKSYQKEVKAVLRRRRIMAARDKFLKDMPKKPAAALTVYCKLHFAEVKREFPDLKPYELRHKLQERWKGLSGEEKATLEQEAQAMMRDYEESLVAYRKSDNFANYLKAAQGRSAKAKDAGKAKTKAPAPPAKPEGLPRKPLDAVKAFLKERAGTGLKLGDAGKAFRELPEEEQERRSQLYKEQMERYNSEMAAFDKTAQGKKYKREMAKFEQRRRLAAAREKLLGKEPKKARSAFGLFADARRSEVQRENPDLKGLGQVQRKLSEIWTGLGEEEKRPFVEKEQELKEEYDKALAEFRSTDGYKKFELVRKRLERKPKAAARAKAKSAAVALPPRPTSMPQRPPGAQALFTAEFRKENKAGDAVAAWRELGADGQKKYLDEEKAKKDEYDRKFKDFQKSPEGKLYLRQKASAEKKMRLSKVKEQLLGGEGAPKEPKRPLTAYFLYVQKARSTMQGEDHKELSKKLNDTWASLPAEEKKVFEDEAAAQKAAYDKAMEEYRNSASFKKYERAIGRIKSTRKPKAKAKAVAKAKASSRAEKAAGKAKAKAKGKAKAKAGGKKADDSDSDVMGSGSGSSSSSSSSDDSDSD